MRVRRRKAAVRFPVLGAETSILINTVARKAKAEEEDDAEGLGEETPTKKMKRESEGDEDVADGEGDAKMFA